MNLNKHSWQSCKSKGRVKSSFFNYFLMVDFSPKTVFRKNPCDFFRYGKVKNEEDDGPPPQPKTAVKTVPPASH